MRRDLRVIMDTAINLYNKLCRRAVEVQSGRTHRMLTAKLQSAQLPITQGFPQHVLYCRVFSARSISALSSSGVRTKSRPLT